MAENNSTIADQCRYSDQENKILDAVIGVTGAISCLSCLFALLLVLLFQKYRTPTQRVILYLTTTVLLLSIVQMVHSTGGDQASEIYCTITGFLDQYAGWMILMAITCLTFDLFVKVVFKWQTTIRMEVIYVLVIYISPVLHTWIPFIDNAYGIAGAWCWIKQYNDDCSRFVFGLVLQFVLYWLPVYVIGTLNLVAYIIARVKAAKRLNNYGGRFDPNNRKNREILLKEVDRYKLYPLIFIVVNFFPLITRIAEASDNQQLIFILGILHALCIGFQGTLIALAFALDKDTRRDLKCSRIKAAFMQTCMTCSRKQSVIQYPLQHASSDSLKRNMLTTAENHDNRNSVVTETAL